MFRMLYFSIGFANVAVASILGTLPEVVEVTSKETMHIYAEMCVDKQPAL